MGPRLRGDDERLLSASDALRFANPPHALFVIGCANEEGA